MSYRAALIRPISAKKKGSRADTPGQDLAAFQKERGRAGKRKKDLRGPRRDHPSRPERHKESLKRPKRKGEPRGAKDIESSVNKPKPLKGLIERPNRSKKKRLLRDPAKGRLGVPGLIWKPGQRLCRRLRTSAIASRKYAWVRTRPRLETETTANTLYKQFRFGRSF